MKAGEVMTGVLAGYRVNVRQQGNIYPIPLPACSARVETFQRYRHTYIAVVVVVG